jgi:hypothetical protein
VRSGAATAAVCARIRLAGVSDPNPPIVRCASCNRILVEPASLPPEARKPCRWCGGMSRNFDVSLSAVVRARATVDSVFISDAPDFDVSVSDTPAPVGDAEELRKLEEANFTLQWERLSPGGAWMLRVFVGDALVDMAIHDDPVTVLLAVADRLLPSSE